MGLLNVVVHKMVDRKHKFFYDDGNLKTLRKLTKQLDYDYVDRLNLETKYKSIVYDNLETLMLTKKNGVIVYLSPNCFNILGHPADDLLYKTFNIIYPDDIEKVSAFLLKASSGVVGKNCEYRIITKDGQVKTVSHSCAPLYVDNEISVIANIIYDKNSFK